MHWRTSYITTCIYIYIYSIYILLIYILEYIRNNCQLHYLFIHVFETIDTPRPAPPSHLIIKARDIHDHTCISPKELFHQRCCSTTMTTNSHRAIRMNINTYLLHCIRINQSINLFQFASFYTVLYIYIIIF